MTQPLDDEARRAALSDAQAARQAAYRKAQARALGGRVDARLALHQAWAPIREWLADRGVGAGGGPAR